MRIVSVRVTGYRSFCGAVEVHLSPGMTCLIGANEHGKSNLLNALDLLDAGTFDEFDRNAKLPPGDAPSLRFTLALSKTDQLALRAALNEYLGQVPDPPADDTGKTTLSILRGTLQAHAQDRLTTADLSVSSRNVRRLHLPTGSFPVMGDSIASPVDGWLRKALPVVHIFQPSSELADSITLQQLDGDVNPPFVGLLKLAGVWEDRKTLFANTRRARQLLDSGAKRLTRKVRKIWSQGSKHTMRLDESGGKLHVSIIDPNTFDTPSSRSLGFRSFFSFYLTLLAQTDQLAPEGMLLLFDEPGIHLHPQGQKDLLREMERLAKNNQIVYATHSPFMIDRNHPASTLLVRKGFTKKDLGTRIVYKPYGKNWHSLHAALGITPADAFFPPDRVLVVEGSSDKVFIAAHMQRSQPDTLADLNNLVVLDADRRKELSGLVRMLLEGGRTVVVLADADQGGDALEKLLKKQAGATKNLRFVDLRRLLGTGKDVSMEDALPFPLFVAALQTYVRSVLGSSHKVDPDALIAMTATQTLGRAVGHYLAGAGVLSSPRPSPSVM